MSNKKYLLPLSILTFIALTACNSPLDSLPSVGTIPTDNSGGTAGGSTPTPIPSTSATPSASPTPVASATPIRNTTPTPTPTPANTGSTTSYPSCVSSDVNHICIGLKIVSYQDSAGVPVITEADAITLVNGMNAVWSQCNIAYQLEVYQLVDPNTRGLTYSPNWQTESDKIRTTFADNVRFLVVAVGPWSSGTIAVTMMPESGIYGTIVDQQYSHNALTVGHELGHYQGLYHLNNSSNLMSPYIGANTSGLQTNQCSIARSTDNTDWPLMLRKAI